MGRAPCCDKSKVKKGPWSPEEDETLKHYLHNYGTGGNWISLPQRAGLKRCGKSCRLRWLNYLRPDIKHGPFTDEEDALILSFYHILGSRWSVIASELQGRTDNDVKNHWNTKLKKKFMANHPIESSALNLMPKTQAYEYDQPLFTAASLSDHHQGPPTIGTSSYVAAVDNNYVGGDEMIKDGFPLPAMDFAGRGCYDLLGGFWSQESTGLEEYLLS